MKCGEERDGQKYKAERESERSNIKSFTVFFYQCTHVDKWACCCLHDGNDTVVRKTQWVQVYPLWNDRHTHIMSISTSLKSVQAVKRLVDVLELNGHYCAFFLLSAERLPLLSASQSCRSTGSYWTYKSLRKHYFWCITTASSFKPLQSVSLQRQKCSVYGKRLRPGCRAWCVIDRSLNTSLAAREQPISNLSVGPETPGGICLKLLSP